VFPPIVAFVAPSLARSTDIIGLIIFLLIVIIFASRWPRGIGRAIVDKLDDLQEAREIEETEKKKVKRFSRWRNALAFHIRKLRKRSEKGET
jgi:Na+-transporting methylmalonyl-CoA/oxaloacetate decarboxylase gamma subunit